MLRKQNIVLYRKHDHQRERLRLNWLYFRIWIFVGVLEEVLPFVEELYGVLIELRLDEGLDIFLTRDDLALAKRPP